MAREVDGHLEIVRAKTSIRELDDAAAALNIDYFLDIVVIGEPTNLSIMLQVAQHEIANDHR